MKIKLLLTALTIMAFVSPLARADGPTPYPDPEDPGAWAGKGPIRVFPYMNDNRKGFWDRRSKDQEAVVFVGDSLMMRYKLAEAFPDLKVANRGIGGDVSRCVLFRVKEDVADLSPKAVVIECGTNDLSAHTDPALVVENLSAIIDQLRESDPKLPIVLCTVPPRDVLDAPTKPGAIESLNEGIKQLAGGKENIALVDIFAVLATPDGLPAAEYFSPDKIHPNEAGYAKWTEQLNPALEKLGIK